MSSIPASSLKTFESVNTTFTWSGATYKAVADISLDYGYNIVREPVTGTNTPYYGTGAFQGKAKAVAIGSSDNLWYTSVSQTSGVVPTIGMTFFAGDINGSNASGHTWTCSGKATKFTQAWQGDKFVKYTVDIELTNEPTVV